MSGRLARRRSALQERVTLRGSKGVPIVPVETKPTSLPRLVIARVQAILTLACPMSFERADQGGEWRSLAAALLGLRLD